MVSLSIRVLQRVHEVKCFLTLSADLFIVSLLFLTGFFHSHLLMGLEEFPSYMSNTILVCPQELLWRIFMHRNRPVSFQRVLPDYKECCFLLHCQFLFFPQLSSLFPLNRCQNVQPLSCFLHFLQNFHLSR